MKKVYMRCCGIDVHKKIIVACFIKKGGVKENRTFGTSTSDLKELVSWLKEGDCQMAAMESTASYWKPIYNAFEIDHVPCIVVNAAHMKNVPGRKTDQSDAAWIADLLQHGLLEASFIPERQQREWRELEVYREALTSDLTREKNRVQKVLEGGNIKISGTIKDVFGKSGRVFLESLIKGEQLTADDIQDLIDQKVISSRLMASNEQLAKDLDGFLTTTQKKLLQEMLGHIDQLNAHIASVDKQIEEMMLDQQKKAVEAIVNIPGIGIDSARAIISVIGTDMSRWANDSIISSWAGLCPGNNESAGKRRSGKTRKGNKLLRVTLTLCAHAAVKCKKSYFYAQYNRICAHRGKKRAIIAVAHSMLIAIYHVLDEGVEYKDLGSDYYNKFNTERKAKSYIKKLADLGYNVELKNATEA